MFVMATEDWGPVIVCNPILEPGGTFDFADEGCLSIPGVTGQVQRATEVLMHFRTPMGASASIRLEGLNARVVQHEVDHLDGILFMDRMPRNLRKQVQRAIEKNLKKATA